MSGWATLGRIWESSWARLDLAACLIRGNRHVRYPNGTPLSNLMLGLTDRYGVKLQTFGDSNSAIDLTTL